MRAPILLYLFALVVRGVMLAIFSDPAYADSAYYVDVPRAIHYGHGFNVDFLWIFAEVGGHLPANPVLPIPSNAHWMPLASLVQVPFLAVLGPSGFASALPFALIGALAAPIAWRIATEACIGPRAAIAVGILTAVPGLVTPFLSQPDNFSLYLPLVAGALLLTTRALKGHRWSFAAAGVLVGLATLSRNDGVLVGITLALAFAWDRWRAWRSRRSGDVRAPAIPWVEAVLALVAFFVLVGPWWLRQLAVFGQLSPSTASGKVLFIRSIEEWDSIDTPATLSWLLGQGIGPLIQSRVGGLVAALEIFGTLIGVVVLVPFMVLGAVLRLRRSAWSADFGPFFAYALLLFGFSAIVSAIHVPGGTFIHSAIALAPYAYILTVDGIVACVRWIARRRPRWNVRQAATLFVGVAVAFDLAAGAFAIWSVEGRWVRERSNREAVARALDAAAAPRSDRLMAIDVSTYRYVTGHGGVVLVDDPLPTVEKVATAYDIRWLVVERADGLESMKPVLAGDRPSWIGPPLAQIPSSDDAAVTVFPVCVAAGDTRCAGS